MKKVLRGVKKGQEKSIGTAKNVNEKNYFLIHGYTANPNAIAFHGYKKWCL